MYFGVNGPISVLAGGVNGIASVIPGQRIKGLSGSQADSYQLGALVPVQLFNLAAAGAGLVAGTVEATFVLPTRCKIPKVNVSFSAIDTLAAPTSSISFKALRHILRESSPATTTLRVRAFARTRQ